MGVYELITTAIDANLKGNICTPFESCGLAELFTDGNQTFPVTADRARKKLLPNPVNRLLTYHRFAGNEERGDVDDNGFGLQINQAFSREMYFVGVGLSKLIHKECGLNDANLGQQIADHFPTSADATTTVNNVQIRITDISTDKAEISASEWPNIPLQNKWPNLSLIRITYEITGNYCKNSCGGDTVDLCPDVTVTDTDGMVYNVDCGDDFTCTNPNVDQPNAAIWANFTNTAEVDGFGLRNGTRQFSSHCLQKNTGAGGSPDAGASSSVAVTAINTTLSLDGFETMLIGLKPGPPAAAVPSTDIIEHGFYIQSASNGKIDIRELAANKTGGVFPISNVRLNYDVDTELEVRFNAGKIQYLLDGVLQYTSATTYPLAQVFHAYAVISQSGAAFLSTQWTL